MLQAVGLQDQEDDGFLQYALATMRPERHDRLPTRESVHRGDIVPLHRAPRSLRSCLRAAMSGGIVPTGAFHPSATPPSGTEHATRVGSAYLLGSHLAPLSNTVLFLYKLHQFNPLRISMCPFSPLVLPFSRAELIKAIRFARRLLPATSL